jgi:hypothetical protein
LNEYLKKFTKCKFKSRCANQGGEGGGGRRGKKACKKRKLVHPSSINDFFGGKGGYQKTSLFNSSLFMRDLVFFIAKSYKALSSVESPWLWKLMM